MGYAVRSAQHNAGMVELGTHARNQQLLSSLPTCSRHQAPGNRPTRKAITPSKIPTDPLKCRSPLSNSLVGTYMHAPIRKFLAPSGLGVE